MSVLWQRESIEEKSNNGFSIIDITYFNNGTLKLFDGRKPVAAKKMNKIQSNELFRMNFVLQDTAATTTKTYLAQIVELILFESEKQGLHLSEIAEDISSKQSLEFSIPEIKEAIERDKNIVSDDELYRLKPKRRSEMKEEPSVEDILSSYIDDAYSEESLGLKMDKAEFKALLMRYVYFCFNSNIENLMALIDGSNAVNSSSFDASNLEIADINRFLMWTNPEKDEFLYKIVSYGYIYCSLNINKNALLSSRIFRNKEFYLDANIIFRLAGINNDDRQRTIVSFIKRCRDVKIILLYTNVTFNEIYNVVADRVNWIKNLNQSQEPLTPNEVGVLDNDFYNLYDDWCKKGNRYDDFASFKSYLLNRIYDVLDDLTEVEIPDYETSNQKLHNEYATHLRDYKNELAVQKEQASEESTSHRKVYGKASASIDISNYLYITNKRKASDKHSIFSTNYFLISADHYFIRWAAERNNGVPVVVLPSVWLTILLRFSGRSDDDFKAFCSFMSLRTHEGPRDIDPFKILEAASRHTTDKELKKRIISEIIQHKGDYSKIENVDDAVCQAFDVIRDQDTNILTESFNKQIAVQRADLERERDSEVRRAEEATNEQNIRTAAEVEVRRKTAFFDGWKKIYRPIAFVFFISFAFATFCWAFQKNPFFSIYENLIPTLFSQSIEMKVTCVGAVWAAMGILYHFIDNFIDYMTGDERKAKIRKKYRLQYQKVQQDL